MSTTTGDPPTGTTPTEPVDCELDEVGAKWTPRPIVCPHAPDADALAQCEAEGGRAILGGVSYPQIQAAIDASAPGEAIVVCPGTHAEILSLSDRSLTAADPTPGVTVLVRPDGLQVRNMPASNAVIRGFTFTGYIGFQMAIDGTLAGECLTGRGARQEVLSSVAAGGTVTLTHSSFHDSSGFVVGGEGTVVVEDSEFLEGRRPAAVQGDVLTVRRSLFRGNRNPDDPDAVGLSVRGGDVLVEQCWFEDNDASADGTAIVAMRATVRDSTFLGNDVDSGISIGGTIAADGFDIADSTFIGNHNDGTDGLMRTGTRSLGNVVVRSRFEGNTTRDAGAVFNLDEGASLVGDRIVVHANLAAGATSIASAVRLQAAASFRCACCDFGSQAEDNVPVDLVMTGIDQTLVDDLPLDFTTTSPSEP